jgi:hypothetical protein
MSEITNCIAHGIAVISVAAVCIVAIQANHPIIAVLIGFFGFLFAMMK